MYKVDNYKKNIYRFHNPVFTFFEFLVNYMFLYKFNIPFQIHLRGFIYFLKTRHHPFIVRKLMGYSKSRITCDVALENQTELNMHQV